MKQVATAVNLPFTALELQYDDAACGIALIIKSAPLLTRARQRRPIYQLAELGLARKILTACGNHYGHADLLEQAKTLELLLAWAEPRIPIPGPGPRPVRRVGDAGRDQEPDQRLHGALRAQPRPGRAASSRKWPRMRRRSRQILPQELTPPASETMPSEEQDQRQSDQADADATRGAEQAGEGPDPTKASD